MIDALTAPQQTAFEGGYFSAAYFAEFQFTTGTARFTSWNTNLDWGGYTWAGAGTLGSINEVRDSEHLQSFSIDFTLSVADPGVVALALTSAENYRSKVMNLYTAPMQDGGILGTPVLTMSGFMDQMVVSLSDTGGSVVLRCVPASDRMQRASNLRNNDVTQQALHPGSLGFAYQAELVANPHLWLSKDFQAQRYGG